MATNFASGTHVHDVYYMSGWVPEFAQFLTPLDDMLPQDLVDDLPPSSFSTVTWDGNRLGVVFTLSLLTLYNMEHLEEAGLNGPPTTWDELKGYAQELTRDGRYGWVLNYGDPPGIGGTASYWMVFLQQAGGTLYGDDGMPVFNDAPGSRRSTHGRHVHQRLDRPRLHLLHRHQRRDQHPHRGQRLDDDELAVHVEAGQRSRDLQDRRQTRYGDPPRRIGGTASIDGTDAWTIANTSANPELAMKLIEFYLDPVVQTRQVLDTGWLPIRLSVLEDPEVQEGAPNAAVVLEQAQHPYDSFVTRITTR